MPVQKFRTPEEAREALWTRHADADSSMRAFRDVLRMAARLTPANPPRGVLRFRSIEAANRERSDRDARRPRR